MNLLLFCGGVNSDALEEEINSSLGPEKSATSKAGSSSSSSATSSTQSETIGIAVFKDDKLVGELNAIETACYLMLTNKLDSCTISIKDPYKQSSSIDLYLYKQKSSKKKVYFVNGSPYVDINVYIKARITSTDKNPKKLDSEAISKIEESANKYLENNIYEFLYKTSQEYNSDICGLGRYGVSQFLTKSDLENYNWLDNYRNCIFNVNVNTDLISSFILTEF